MQHTLRQEGDFDYRLADDTQIAMNARYALSRGHRGTFSMGVGVLGQDKGTDTVAGDPVAGTQMRSIFAGPVLTYAASTASSLRASLAVDLPVYQDNTDLALVVDRRVRFGATARF